MKPASPIEVICKAPDEVSAEQIAAALALIASGRAVNPNTAAAELPRVKLIALAQEPKKQRIIGVGAIKRPRPQYASYVAEQSGFPLAPNTHELGYVSVDASSRGLGISHRIAHLLLLQFQERPVFATTSHDGMKRTLSHAGFCQQGREWPGEHGNLSLWIKS